MIITITGATGFLGTNAVKYFVEQGHTVYALGRNIHKGQALIEHGAIFIQASLLEISKMETAVKESEIVIHSAALSSPWGKEKDFYEANILGTQNIINLCLKHQVKKVIHISTPSLYFKFKDEFDISEKTILSNPFASEYTKTKFEAEKIVEKAHEKGLFTITLRPRGIFGPGDETLLPRLIKIAGENGLPQLGNGQNIIDITYVDNVTHAIEQCLSAAPHCNGEKYNITNGEPIHLWTFLKDLFQRLEIQNSSKKIPFPLAYITAWLMEIFYKTFQLTREPPITRYTVGLLAKSQTLDIRKARAELNYNPKVSMEDAVTNVIKWWNENESNN